MVNIRTSKKRKSNYNSSRSRLSRRVKRGGGGEEGKKDVDLLSKLSQLSSRLFGPNKQEKKPEPIKEEATKPVTYVKPTSDEEYLKLSSKIKADHTFITDKSIANGAITDEDWGTLTQEQQKANRNSDRLPTILSQMKAYQIEQYRKLLQKSKPEYPYARKQTATDREKLRIKELEEEKERLRWEAQRPNKVYEGFGRD